MKTDKLISTIFYVFLMVICLTPGASARTQTIRLFCASGECAGAEVV